MSGATLIGTSFESTGGTMFIFGGQSQSLVDSAAMTASGALDDMWMFTLSSGRDFANQSMTGVWRKVTTRGKRPAPRYGHSLVYVASIRSVILFAGFGGVGQL